MYAAALWVRRRVRAGQCRLCMWGRHCWRNVISASRDQRGRYARRHSATETTRRPLIVAAFDYAGLNVAADSILAHAPPRSRRLQGFGFRVRQSRCFGAGLAWAAAWHVVHRCNTAAAALLCHAHSLQTAVLRSVLRRIVLASFARALRRPIVHHCPPLREQIAATVRRLHFAFDCVRQRGLGNLARIISCFRDPVPERRCGNHVRSGRRASCAATAATLPYWTSVGL